MLQSAAFLSGCTPASQPVAPWATALDWGVLVVNESLCELAVLSWYCEPLDMQHMQCKGTFQGAHGMHRAGIKAAAKQGDDRV